MKRWGWQPWTSPDGQPQSVIDTKVNVRLVGDLQSELVYDFFEGFARGAQCQCPRCKFSTDAPTIIRLKRCSKPLRARCARPAGATSRWRDCCPAPKDCYDRDRRLSAGNLTSVKKAFEHHRGRTLSSLRSCKLSRKQRRSCCPAWGTSLRLPRLHDNSACAKPSHKRIQDAASVSRHLRRHAVDACLRAKKLPSITGLALWPGECAASLPA